MAINSPGRTTSIAAVVLLTFAVACFAIWGLPRPSKGGGGGGGGDWKKPGFCGKLDCPEFTVWQKHYDFQIREYKEATWIATNVTALEYDEGVKRAMPLLMDYIYGANNGSVRMKETVPLFVSFQAELHPHMHEMRNYTVAMFLPYKHQDSPPQPNNTALWLFKSPPKATVGVRGFQHRAREWRVINETRALVDALSHAGHDDLMTGEVMVASYEPVMKHRRHHRRRKYSEVWMQGNFKNATVTAAAA